MKDYLTAKEIAARLGRDVSSVHRWLRRSKVKPVKMLANAESRGQRVAYFDAGVVKRLAKDTYVEGGQTNG